MAKKNQAKTSKENSRFWDELCGSQLAKHLGIQDSSPSSLKKFDDWYFEFYPYLSNHIQFEDLKGKKVLEVGLGYGSVSQKIAGSGAHYHGLDIAAGPVTMVKQRLAQAGFQGEALVGDILSPPFNAGEFDVIVAIGCLHHTGDLRKAVKNCFKLLRAGGRLTFMVYYAYSYRRWTQALRRTLAYLCQELKGFRGVVGDSESWQRAAYDRNAAGEGAPHTDWISKKSLAEMCKEFKTLTMQTENLDTIPMFPKLDRHQLLKTKLPFYIGLDLYASATK